MSFRADVIHALGADAFHTGLGALRPADRAHVSITRPRELLGSANVDQSLAEALPNAARWDYLVGHPEGNQHLAHWIEFHPARSDANVREVGKKLAWLMGWLRGNPLAAYRRDIVWVAAGKSAFNVRAPGVKALAARGVVLLVGICSYSADHCTNWLNCSNSAKLHSCRPLLP